MAASEGLAKRASIGVQFTDTDFVDTMNRFKDLLTATNKQVDMFHGALDRTDSSLASFTHYMDEFADHHGQTMDRVRQQTRDTIEQTNKLKGSAQNIAQSYGDLKDKVDSDNHLMDESERQRYQNAIDNEHKINELLSHTATVERRTADQTAQANARLKDRLNSVGESSEHNSNRIASANGRVARSFRYSNLGIGRHIQSVRDAQSRDYRWLRTAQDMSGATLGLGLAFYKGAKETTNLQQSYMHASNMAYYGGEKMKQVQHDMNAQYRTGTALSIKYGTSQQEIADGFKTMVARGYSTTEALHAQKTMLQASIASGDSYNDVVQNSTNILDDFGMRTNNAAKMSQNAKTAINQMAYAADQTASNFHDLGIGMAYVGATAHTAHQSIAETSTALGELSNNGMQASMAGTGLRKVLNSFLSINQKGQQAQVMKQLGLTEQDFKTKSGNLKSLNALMGELNRKTDHMDSQQRASVFHRFFGTTGQEAALNLAKDTKATAKLEKQVAAAPRMGHGKGYVNLLSKKNMKSAQEQLRVFKYSWQAFTMTAARTLLPTLMKILKYGDKIMLKFNELPNADKKWAAFGALAVAAISPIAGAVFGIQSAFHGVEITLLHVRKLFAKPVSNNMSDSALNNSKEQDAAALTQGYQGKFDSPLALKEYAESHPHLYKHNLRRMAGHMNARLGLGMRKGLSPLARIGGDYGHAAADVKPSMLARLNPFNRSARFFTGRFTPFKKVTSALTGVGATNALRGTGTNMLKRFMLPVGGLLGKANLITGIATSLPMIVSGLKLIDKTRIGNKTFGPLNRSIIRALHGPIRSIDRSWGILKRDAFQALKPIIQEWHKMFGDQTKGEHSGLKEFQTCVHVIASLFSSLFRTVIKSVGDILKTLGHMIAGVMKYFRGVFTGLDGLMDILHGHFRKGFHMIWHGAQICTSGLWNAFSGALKGIGHLFEDVFGGALNLIHKVVSGVGDITHLHPIKHLEGHANGGAIPRDEMSLVNERGQESAYNPKTNSFRLLGNNGPQVLKLYAGEHVLDAQDTHELLTTGLGKGVTLPGYANGTDTLNALRNKVLHGFAMGTGRAANISAGVNKQPEWMHNFERNYIDTALPSWMHIGADLRGFHAHPFTRTLSAAADLLPYSSKLKHVAPFLRHHISSKPLIHIGTVAAHSLKNGWSNFDTKYHFISGLLDKPFKVMGRHSRDLLNKIDPDELNRNAKKIWPALKYGLENVKDKAKSFLHGGIMRSILHPKRTFDRIRRSMDHEVPGLMRGFRRIGHGIRHFGRRSLRFGKRMFRTAKHGIRRFGRGALHIGRRLVRGGHHLLRVSGHGISHFSKRAIRWTGRTARSMWHSMRSAGRRIWHDSKRVSRNVWHTTKRLASDTAHTMHHLWDRTKQGASHTWSFIKSHASRLFHSVLSRGRSAWQGLKSGVSGAVSVGKRMLGGLLRFAAHVKHFIENIHMPHFALGGAIRHTTMALVGEHGPETAYSPRTGMIRMLGMNGPQITTLLAGEEVLTNTQTNRLLHGGLGRGNRLPAYARGTNARLSGPASRSSRFNIIGSFSGKTALHNMSAFRDAVKAIWKDIYKSVDKTTNDLSDDTRGTFKEMSNKVGKLSDDLKDGLTQKAQETAEGFGDKFKKLIDYAKEDMESVIGKLNRGVSGIDKALSAFGGNNHVISPIHYATGTMNGRIAYNQLGILNDAISGPRQEAVLRGNQVLFPQGDNVPVPLQKGDAVLNGTQTKELINNTTVNHYAKGSGLHISDRVIKGITHTLSTALKGPAKFFANIFGKAVGSPSGHQLTEGITTMASRAVKPLGNKWTQAMFSFIHSLINPSDTATSSKLLNYAEKTWMHVPYVVGGTTRHGADCGGAVMTLLHHFGVNIPHVDQEHSSSLKFVGTHASEARPGDLVYFGKKNHSMSGLNSHVGIYAGHGKMWNECPPRSMISSVAAAAAEDGLWGYWRVKAMKDNVKKPKSSPLTRLVSSELGSSAIHWLKALSSQFSNGGVNVGNEKNPAGVSVGRWKPYVIKALHDNHFAATPFEVAAWLHVIRRESNGNPHAVNHWDINAKEGHPSEGLVQTIGPTFSANHFPGHDDIFNGFDDLLAGIHYMAAKYGRGHSAFARVSGPEGYANGGWAIRPSIFGEAGPEVAINPRKSSADSLIMQAIYARIKANPSSRMAQLIKSLSIRRKGLNLRNAVNGLLSHVANTVHSVRSQRPVNINISFGDINVTSTNGNINTGALSNKIKRAIKVAIQKAAYESATKLN